MRPESRASAGFLTASQPHTLPWRQLGKYPKAQERTKSHSRFPRIQYQQEQITGSPPRPRRQPATGICVSSLPWRLYLHLSGQRWGSPGSFSTVREETGHGTGWPCCLIRPLPGRSPEYPGLQLPGWSPLEAENLIFMSPSCWQRVTCVPSQALEPKIHSSAYLSRAKPSHLLSKAKVTFQ